MKAMTGPIFAWTGNVYPICKPSVPYVKVTMAVIGDVQQCIDVGLSDIGSSFYVAYY